MSYRIFEQNFISEEGIEYKSYGIKDENGRCIKDVSLNRNKLKELTDRINQENIKYPYICYIIEDFICQE